MPHRKPGDAAPSPADSIPWHTLERDAVAQEEELFYLIASASFMKVASNVDVVKLVNNFPGDDELTKWLKMHWKREEIQHGQMLRHYIQSVWPKFDWDSVYHFFLVEYAPSHLFSAPEQSLSLELASRYVMEVCAAGFYAAIGNLTRDPVLKLLAQQIQADEVRHYEHFYRHFVRYSENENINRTRVFGALIKQLRSHEGADSLVALKYIYGACHPTEPFDMDMYRNMRSQCRQYFLPRFPRKASAHRLLEPLKLGAVSAQLALPIVRIVSGRLMA
jgi:hypothetical protein